MQEDYKKFEIDCMTKISKKIKSAREARKISQEYLAEKVDCSREFINRIENRKEDVSLKMLLRLAHFLNIPPSKFF